MILPKGMIIPDRWTWTIQPNWAILPMLITVQLGENESALGNNCLNHFLRKWLSEPFPNEMTVMHQPPKRTILQNCSQLWTSKEWLPGEADHSTWPLLRVTAKKNDCPRPFPHTDHKGNCCLWYISNLSNHFHYENDCPIWTIFRTRKCMSVRNLKPLSE